MKLASVVVFLVACGSVHGPTPPDANDGGGGGATASVNVVFPPTSGMTDASEIVVRGTAEDADGITAIRVNGVAAVSDAEFATWEVTVPLVTGVNELVVEVEDRRGDIVSATPRTVVVSPNPLANPSSISADLTILSTQAFVGDGALRAVLAIDRTTGARTLVTGQGRGAGPELTSISAVAFDAQKDRVIVAGNGLFAVDVATGDRTAIVTDSQFTPVGVTLLGNRAFVITRGILSPDIIQEVNLTTGARATFSGAGTGTGPELMAPADLVVDGFNNRLLVVDEGLEAVVAIGLDTGNRSVLAGSGPAFDRPIGITIESVLLQAPSQAWVVDAALRAVIRIDLATGARSVISSDAIGSGEPLVSPRAIAYTNAGDLAVTDAGAHGVVRIAPADGARTSLSSGRAGTGPAHPSLDTAAPAGGSIVLVDGRGVLRFDVATGERGELAAVGGDVSLPSGVIVEPDNASALLAVGSGRLMRIELASGAPVLIEGTGPTLPLLSRLTFDNNGDVIAGGAGTVLHVDMTSGARSVISDGSRGAGPMLGAVTGIAMDGDRVIALDAVLDAVVAIDGATGDRTIVSNATTGSGPTLDTPSGIAVASGIAFVVDSSLDALVGVSLAGGNRTVISDASKLGPMLTNPVDVDVDVARDLAFVTDRSLGLFAVDLATGQRLIVSH